MYPDDNDPQTMPELPEDSGQQTAGEAPDLVAQLEAERDAFKDLLLRKTAEFDNYRKRTERERREFVEYANAELLREILPLIDDLERASHAEGEASVDAYVKGVALIARQAADLLARRGVEVLDPLGEDFDPHWHEAVAREAVEGTRDGQITAVLSRGYRIKDRLLRPAMVKVATA